MAASTVRRGDFLMTLAYGTDLATGHSRDFALRSCVLAMRMADAARLDDPIRRAVYHQASFVKAAGHVGKPQPAILGGKYGA